MRVTKALCSNGMPTLFFQKFCDIVRSDVTKAILGFLNGEDFIDEINQTFIVLIPKKHPPQDMKQLRPISLCNIFYKIISKVLANRLKAVLPSVIS